MAASRRAHAHYTERTRTCPPADASAAEPGQTPTGGVPEGADHPSGADPAAGLSDRPTPPGTPSEYAASREAPAGVRSLPRRLRDRARRHPVLLVTAVAGLLHLAWFFTFANSGGDLAAQDAWAEFVGRNPGSAYNLAWYGGMHPVSYSVVSPYLMSLLGVRTTMMLAGTVSAALLTLILVRVRPVRNPLPAAWAGLFGLLGNALSGRVTFGLGTMFALAAVAAVFCWPHRWRYRRWAKAVCAAPLAALATMASPVAGLFTGLVAVAMFLQKRRPGAWALGLPPTLVVALSAYFFPFSGTQPMSFGSAFLPFLFAALVAVLVPRDWVTVRITAGVYGLAVLLVWLINSQIGSNVTRLSMLFAGAVLVAALPFAAPRSRRWYALSLAAVGFAVWIGVKSYNDVVNTTPRASWARELAPLLHQLREVGAERGRVEVVPARSHREASALDTHVNLARGWNRQADIERNPLFYDGSLNSANYHAWLKRWAVQYVVLPKDEPDGDGGRRERQLVEGGLPYLHQVWGDANWRLFEVTDPTPLAEPNAVVERAGQDEWTVRVAEAGRVLVRIPYSPWLSLVDSDGKRLEAPKEVQAPFADGDTDTDTDGVTAAEKVYDNTHGCLMGAEEDTYGDVWTTLVAPEAGTYRLTAPYVVPRGTPCPAEWR